MARTVAERDDLLPQLADVFRTHGYDGASIGLISQATGLGKGSLYHFFPGGKEQMARAVLVEIDLWFEAHVFTPLLMQNPPRAAIDAMFVATYRYFEGGGRICLAGMLALGATRDRFATAIAQYFLRWIDALSAALIRTGQSGPEARDQAERIVAGIQGAVILTRALDAPDLFGRLLADIRAATDAATQAQ